MSDTLTTVRGTIVKNPTIRQVGDVTVVGLRVACNNRYLDRTSGEWKTVSTLFLTVTCWGHLATSVAGRLFQGDGIIAQGRLNTDEYTDAHGERRSDLSMRAIAVGADVARAEVSLKRRGRPEQTDGDAGAGERTDGATTGQAATTGSVSAGEGRDADTGTGPIWNTETGSGEEPRNGALVGAGAPLAEGEENPEPSF